MSLQLPIVQKSITSLSGILKGEDSVDKKQELVLDHIKLTEREEKFKLPLKDFPQNLKWFNTDRPLSFSDQLKGKITVLDFFTYCCINCIHILPDLHKLAERYHDDSDGLTIVGIHSPKFPNEKDTINLLNAILRYDITHPVINDVNIEMWEAFGISCWPTLVIIGPKGQLMYYIIGEGHYLELELFVETAIKYYKSHDVLSLTPVGVALEKNKLPKNVLNFPGKLTAKGGVIYITDSSNHRVLVVDGVTGLVKQVYGSGCAGCKDGIGEGAEFNSPQGLVVCGNELFVADTDNHLIRKINLSDNSVVTIAGTGCQGNDKIGGKMGTEQEISSPWDLAISADSSILYIAMAGTHQVWAYTLKDVTIFKKEYKAGSVVAIIGSGEEANRNNSFPHKASLAQPSGIDLSTDGSLMFIADSESSTVRMISTVNGGVKGLVGGALDPMDLFAFGDVDGKGRDVRLQHPLGVVWDESRQLLYVTDSYNHKIKVINHLTKQCTTLAGTGIPGLTNGPFKEAQFSEPSGLCVINEGDNSYLLVSDTNNHVIRKLDLKEEVVSEFSVHLTGSESTDSSTGWYVPITRSRLVTMVTFDLVHVPTNEEMTLSVHLKVKDGFKLNQEGQWQIIPVDSSSIAIISSTKGPLNNDSINIKMRTQGEETTAVLIKVELLVMFCSTEDDTCLMKQYILTQPLEMNETKGITDHSISINIGD